MTPSRSRLSDLAALISFSRAQSDPTAGVTGSIQQAALLRPRKPIVSSAWRPLASRRQSGLRPPPPPPPSDLAAAATVAARPLSRAASLARPLARKWHLHGRLTLAGSSRASAPRRSPARSPSIRPLTFEPPRRSRLARPQM